MLFENAGDTITIKLPADFFKRVFFLANWRDGSVGEIQTNSLLILVVAPTQKRTRHTQK